MTRRLLLTVIVCLVPAALTTLGAGSQGDRTHANDVRRNIAVDPLLRGTIRKMLDRSPTFADQIRSLGDMTLVRVAIVLKNESARAPQERRARCVLSRYQFGRIEAIVEVSSAANIAELIAHELEHVLEFAEGLNYRVLAVTRPNAVWASQEGCFETKRAIDAGEQVGREAWRAQEALVAAKR